MKLKWKNLGMFNGKQAWGCDLPNAWSVEVKHDSGNGDWLWAVFQRGMGRTPFVAGTYTTARSAMRSFERFARAIQGGDAVKNINGWVESINEKKPTKSPRASKPQPAAGPWVFDQPAPKDGSYILGYWDVGGYILAAWGASYKCWIKKSDGRGCVGEPQCWARINAPVKGGDTVSKPPLPADTLKAFDRMDRVAAARKTLQPAAGPWVFDQPAPKDGSYILGYWDVGGYALASWGAMCKRWIKKDNKRFCVGEPQCWARINAPVQP